jgi:ribosomal protein S14
MEKRIIIRVFIEKEAVIENSMIITTLRKKKYDISARNNDQNDYKTSGVIRKAYFNSIRGLLIKKKKHKRTNVTL